jgi:Fe-S-cluster-containing hydrogenase component 2
MLCVRLCPYGARKLEAKVMELNESRCRSCSLCASVCAAGALRLSGELP